MTKPVAKETGLPIAVAKNVTKGAGAPTIKFPTTKRKTRASKKDRAGQPDVKEADRIMQKIVSAQEEIKHSESKTIPILVAIGVELIKLRKVATRDWAKRIRKLGYHPREASRYTSLGEKWGAEIGTIGSEILQELTTDIKSLEAICQLSFDQLKSFVESKRADEAEGPRWDRQRIAQEVNEILGRTKPQPEPITADTVATSFKRAVAKAITMLQRANLSRETQAEIQDRLRRILDDEFAGKQTTTES